MKELIIQVKINENQTATIIKKNGFDNNVSTNFEIIGILQNLIKIEQDKLDAKTTTITKTADN